MPFAMKTNRIKSFPNLRLHLFDSFNFLALVDNIFFTGASSLVSLLGMICLVAKDPCKSDTNLASLYQFCCPLYLFLFCWGIVHYILNLNYLASFYFHQFSGKDLVEYGKELIECIGKVWTSTLWMVVKWYRFVFMFIFTYTFFCVISYIAEQLK